MSEGVPKKEPLFREPILHLYLCCWADVYKFSDWKNSLLNKIYNFLLILFDQNNPWFIKFHM